MAADHRKRGKRLLARNRLNEAFEHLNRAFEMDPSHLPNRLNIGVCCYHLGQLDDAIQHFRYVLSFEPKNPDALLNIGAAWNQKEDYGSALEILKRLVDTHHDFPDSHYNLAIVHIGLGDYKSAFTQLSEELRRDPKHKQAQKVAYQLIELHEKGEKMREKLNDVE